ncbi:hypothetical protein BC829DRAFT_168461 [Chytridium lagenaria]|nr:hypothetical protein BC829DRAFT_168461 [Chytridium lagenaria]
MKFIVAATVAALGFAAGAAAQAELVAAVGTNFAAIPTASKPVSPLAPSPFLRLLTTLTKSPLSAPKVSSSPPTLLVPPPLLVVSTPPNPPALPHRPTGPLSATSLVLLSPLALSSVDLLPVLHSLLPPLSLLLPPQLCPFTAVPTTTAKAATTTAASPTTQSLVPRRWLLPLPPSWPSLLLSCKFNVLFSAINIFPLVYFSHIFFSALLITKRYACANRIWNKWI